MADRVEFPARVVRDRRRTFVAIAVVALTLAGLWAWPVVRVHLQSVAVLDLVANQPVPKGLRWTVDDAVTVKDVTFSSGNGLVAARLYEPVGHPDAPAMVVLHGVHHLGMNEPRLISFARAMASCGLRVLTPELPDIKDYHVGANSIATIGDAAKWMATQRVPRGGFALAPPPAYQPVGVMGLSFSGGLSLLAAASPEYHRYIKFVVAIGSQAAMSRVAAYYRTGIAAMPEGGAETLAPHEYGALVLEYENLADFVPEGDLAPLRAVLRAHLYEDPAAEKVALAALTPAQAAEAKRLMDTTSAATRAMLQADEAKHAAEMAAVSPEGHLKGFTTPVYLLHGEGDNIIPAAETRWMARELPPQALAAVLVSPVLSHLDLDGHGPGARDQARLVHFFAQVLGAAEGR